MSSNKTFFPVIELWSRLCTKHLKYPEKFTRTNVLSTSLLRQYHFFINITSHLKCKVIFAKSNSKIQNHRFVYEIFCIIILNFFPWIKFSKTMLNDMKEC